MSDFGQDMICDGRVSDFSRTPTNCGALALRLSDSKPDSSLPLAPGSRSGTRDDQRPRSFTRTTNESCATPTFPTTRRHPTVGNVSPLGWNPRDP